MTRGGGGSKALKTRNIDYISYYQKFQFNLSKFNFSHANPNPELGLNRDLKTFCQSGGFGFDSNFGFLKI